MSFFIIPNTAFSPSDVAAKDNYPCEDDSPSLEAVCSAARQLRNNRAPGDVGITVEVYKTCLVSLGPWLHRMIAKVSQITWVKPFFFLFSRRETSESNRVSKQVIESKRLKVNSNNRGQKIRIREAPEHSPCESGFRPGQEWMNQMHNLRRTLGQRWSFQ